jgi:membrane protein implicated in regulation of membrane protease activity
VPVAPLAFRTTTLVAAGFLALDGAALAGVGIWSDRSALLLAGAGLLIASGLVLVFWRRHLRRLREIAAARRELRDEADELRRILRG